MQLSEGNFEEKEKNWSQVPDGRLTPGQTVGRKLTSTDQLKTPLVKRYRIVA
jgi:hypothetical protein